MLDDNKTLHMSTVASLIATYADECDGSLNRDLSEDELRARVKSVNDFLKKHEDVIESMEEYYNELGTKVLYTDRY